MIRKLKHACGIHFSGKALVRNPRVHLLQMTRHWRSFRDLLDLLAKDRRIAVVQVGANDGTDALGDKIRARTDRIDRALLIEPQPAAFGRLIERFGSLQGITCLNVAIDHRRGRREIYSVSHEAGRALSLGDGIASFDRDHVEREIRSGMGRRPDGDIAATVTVEMVETMTLGDAAAMAGIDGVDVLMVDAEGFDAEIVRMSFETGWSPTVIQYEHKHLPPVERSRLSAMLRRRGYSLWADHADVWGCRKGLLARPQKEV